MSPSASRTLLYTGSHLLRTGRTSDPDSENSETTTNATASKEMDNNGMYSFRSHCPVCMARVLKIHILCYLWAEKEGSDLDDQSSNRLSVRERRRPKDRRRGTGINFWTKDVSTLVWTWHTIPPVAASLLVEVKRKSPMKCHDFRRYDKELLLRKSEDFTIMGLI